MASSLWKLNNKPLHGCITSTLLNSIRNGHKIRGKPPGVAKSIDQVLAEAKYQDPSIHFRVDIGLPLPQTERSKVLQERLKVVKGNRKNASLEKLSRNKELLIDLDVFNKEWLKTSAPHQIKTIADHYSVYQHLFEDAYFYPIVPLTVLYETDDGDIPIYFGNVLKPNDAKKKPKIEFESDSKDFWTLILTNPDGHFTQSNSEYVHWFVGNIPGNDISKGETLVEYLQPFPPKGTGYHRHIFVLYKQEKKLDFSSFKKKGLCLDLPQRTFCTYDFYRDRQEDLTPAGLAFFQADWDPTLKDFYHNVLNMQQPIYEYDFPPPFIRKQEWFPRQKKPFNLYMDKYRDPKQINKEFLMRKFKDIHPFKGPPPPLPYPNSQYFNGYVPSWLKLEIRKSRLKWGRINEIE